MRTNLGIEQLDPACRDSRLTGMSDQEAQARSELAQQGLSYLNELIDILDELNVYFPLMALKEVLEGEL